MAGMTSGKTAEQTIFSNDELAAELARLGIYFVKSSVDEILRTTLAPEAFVAALAASSEARLRMALIPLFLSRPEFIRFLPGSANMLSAQARVTLMCYYTAAALLQRKYAQSLEALGISNPEMPDLFGRDLDLPVEGDADALLERLGARQAALSGRSLNWRGTYEQAANRFMRRLQQERAWAVN